MRLFDTPRVVMQATLGIIVEILYTAAIMLVSYIVCLAFYFKRWS